MYSGLACDMRMLSLHGETARMTTGDGNNDDDNDARSSEDEDCSHDASFYTAGTLDCSTASPFEDARETFYSTPDKGGPTTNYCSSLTHSKDANFTEIEVGTMEATTSGREMYTMRKLSFHASEEFGTIGANINNNEHGDQGNPSTCVLSSTTSDSSDCRGALDVAMSTGISATVNIKRHEEESTSSDVYSESCLRESIVYGKSGEVVCLGSESGGQRTSILSVCVDLGNTVWRITNLNLTGNLIQSLDELECFVNLRELILDKNNLSDQIIGTIPLFSQLHTLSLNYNRLSNLKALTNTLAERAPCLVYVSLLGNPLCGYQLFCHSTDRMSDDVTLSNDDAVQLYTKYRVSVLCKLSNLMFLDHRAFTEQERQQARMLREEMQIKSDD